VGQNETGRVHTCEDSWVREDGEFGFLHWRRKLTRRSMFPNVVASMAGEIATSAEMARTRQAGTGSVLQSTNSGPPLPPSESACNSENVKLSLKAAMHI
jgi:hypothetical protein